MDTYKDGKRVTEEVKKEKKPETSHLAKSGGPDAERVAKELILSDIKEYFGVEGSDKNHLLEVIHKFFRENGDEKEDLFSKIRKAESKLSKNPFEDRITRLYRYVKLIKSIRNELAEL